MIQLVHVYIQMTGMVWETQVSHVTFMAMTGTIIQILLLFVYNMSQLYKN